MQVAPGIRGRVKVLSGNHAGAMGVLLCRPQVISAYPITPQTPILEQLYRFISEGTLKAESVEVEGEHSALSVLIGAAAAGARTFTATSSQGLLFMYEAYLRVSGLRLPILMVIVTRETDAPGVVSSSQQDAICVRDGGWIQLHAETCQEILDSIIISYKLAEDPAIQLPVNICYDGYYLSHLSEKVVIPLQEDVDAFLPPLDRGNLRLDPRNNMVFPCFVPTGEIFTEYRLKHQVALEKVKTRLEEIEGDFKKIFGRSYGGQIEEYRTEDADILLVCMGSAAGTARVAVDRKRAEGIKAGLVKLRLFRPFPRERLLQACRGKKGVGVVDRNVSFGWDCGAVYMELKAAIAELGQPLPMAGFIDGLGGCDVTVEHLCRAIDITQDASLGKPFPRTTWLALR